MGLTMRGLSVTWEKIPALTCLSNSSLANITLERQDILLFANNGLFVTIMKGISYHVVSQQETIGPMSRVVV